MDYSIPATWEPYEDSIAIQFPKIISSSMKTFTPHPIVSSMLTYWSNFSHQSLLNNIFRCRYTPINRRKCTGPGNVYQTLKNSYMISGCWNCMLKINHPNPYPTKSRQKRFCQMSMGMQIQARTVCLGLSLGNSRGRWSITISKIGKLKILIAEIWISRWTIVFASQ